MLIFSFRSIISRSEQLSNTRTQSISWMLKYDGNDFGVFGVWNLLRLCVIVINDDELEKSQRTNFKRSHN